MLAHVASSDFPAAGLPGPALSEVAQLSIVVLHTGDWTRVFSTISRSTDLSGIDSAPYEAPHATGRTVLRQNKAQKTTWSTVYRT